MGFLESVTENEDFSSSMATQMILPYPYGFSLALIGTIILPIYFIRQWSIEWNRKISEDS